MEAVASRGAPVERSNEPQENGASTETEETNPELERKKQDWARQMRLLFSPPEMLHEDGAINFEYFKPKNMSAMQLKAQAKKWGEKEKDLLLQAIAKHGIGSWALIKSEFLPQWEATELRIKTARLMGRQSLVQYIDTKWKGSPSDVSREYERNKAIALKYNCWKGGVLVNDDEGQVLKVLEAQPFATKGQAQNSDAMDEDDGAMNGAYSEDDEGGN